MVDENVTRGLQEPNPVNSHKNNDSAFGNSVCGDFIDHNYLK